MTDALTTTRYLYGLERLVALKGNTGAWYVNDGLGSVRQTISDTGAPLSKVNYDPWGQVESGSVPTFGFTGELQDSANGLVNLRARWYHAGHGTFTSKDPFGGDATLPYSLHPYQYGYSDPVLLTDPSGQTPCLPKKELDVFGYTISIGEEDCTPPPEYCGSWVWGAPDCQRTDASPAAEASRAAMYAVSACASGALQQWDVNTTGNEYFMAKTGEDPAVSGCRHLGNIASIASGTIEAGIGGTLMFGGGAACLATAGGGCVIGGGQAVAAGGVLAAHGLSTVVLSLANEGRMLAACAASNDGANNTAAGNTQGGDSGSSTPLTVKPKRIGGRNPPRNGRGVPSRGNTRPRWANSSTPGRDGTTTGGLIGHARKHGGEGGGIVPHNPQAYYDQAVQNINFGQEFTYLYGGQKKFSYITKVGEDSYLFTATTQSRKLIFTHMVVPERYLNNYGIYLAGP